MEEEMRRQSEADDEIDFELVFGRKKVPAKASTTAPLNLTGLGTVGGVLLPCVQNIIGVLVFLRLPWICGQSGIVIATVQVCICVAVTSLTSLSMAAIATNGKIRAGGSYAMISSCLGPSFGISIGILFYLGTAVGSGMYVLGAAEAFLNTVKIEENPTLSLADSYVNNLRLWGLIVGLLLFLCVSTGIKRVSAIGVLFLIPVFIGIIAAWVGVFVAGEPEGVSETYPTDLFPDVTGSIGLSLSNIKNNLWPDYQSGISFGSTLAVLFPGLTGFEAGSNRSGRLKDPSRAIPVGTAWAIISTTFVYLSFIFLFGACVPRQVLQDLEKEGFIVAKVAWPYPLVVQIAVILSSAGAGLQTLAGAPEILAAISTDFKSEIPCLRRFAIDSADAEPRKALLFSTLLVLLVVCLGDINVVAPIITQFLVLAYIFINVACVLMVVLKSPSWRPTFKHFSKYSGSVAVLLGVFIMFVDSWYMAVISVGIFLGLYYYIQSLSIERDWGDGIKGMKYTQAIENLLDLNYYSHHVRNYRPSFLLIQEMSIVIDPYSNQPTFDKNPIDQPLLELSNTLTLGKGGTQMIAVIEADSDDRKNPWETNTDANKLSSAGLKIQMNTAYEARYKNL